MKPIIKVENLSKQYRLGNIGTGTIRDDFQRWLHRLQGKEDPFLKIGETNDRSAKGNSDYVWALKDINFEVMPGEVLGIIGKNGAGKSTLLKILSNVTGPTTGSISYNGRIGSLLEVGTGFHPELTGRENIFLNGAILGMKKYGIRSKLDEIIDFSGCERYIDTPVKRYSSGMTVRLGFAIAAYLDPEILIVDEVLAVGDAEFQDKAIGKMQNVSKAEGRTVLFVSHNMAAVTNLCKTCIILENGTVKAAGKVDSMINEYLSIADRKNIYHSDRKIPEGVWLKSSILVFMSQRIIKIETDIYTSEERQVSIDFRFKTKNGIPIGFGSCGTFNNAELLTLKKGLNKYIFQFSVEDWAIGKYFISVDLTQPDVIYYERLENIMMFELVRKSENDRRVLDLDWNYGPLQINFQNV